METSKAQSGAVLKTVLSRRSILKVGLATLLSPRFVVAGNNKGNAPLFISGARIAAGITDGKQQYQYVAVVFDEQGRQLASLPLAARAHGAASHRGSHRACVFARRPGLYLSAFDRRQPQLQTVVHPVAGRHFYGHGSYSEQGDFLYATENDYEGMRGVLGIYDTGQGYRRIGEIDTAGVGPHEVVRIPGTPLLVVANGGIHTHPDSGREKLNIETMQASVSIIDTRDGKRLAHHVLPETLHQISIRHLACADDGQVWFACQYEGESAVIDGLAGVVSIEASLRSFRAGYSRAGLRLLEVPDALQQRMAHYISSVAIVGEHVLFTSSKGGVVFKVARHSAQIVESVSVRDCSGVVATPVSEEGGGLGGLSEDALITSGTGEIVRLEGEDLRSLGMHSVQWDNHVYAL